MRLFIAATIIKDGVYKIKKIQQKFKDFSFLRILPEENLHITLLFLGNTDPLLIPEIRKAIKNSTKNLDSKKIKIYFKKVSQGPNPFRPRLIWVEAESNDLKKMKYSIDEEFKKHKDLKKFLEHREFLPHITIARKKRDKIWEKNSNPINLHYTTYIDKIVLFQSILKKTGAEYIPLYYVNLAKQKE